MTLRQKTLTSAVALALIATTPVQAASSASINRAFRDAVAQVLGSVKNQTDYLRAMSSSEFRQFVSCAQQVMDAAPLARKQYVLAASNRSEQRQRFDEVALDNQAKLKKQITRQCA